LPVGDGASLLRRRPDVLQAERTLAADTARIGVATADFFPTVSLTGNAATSGTSLKQIASAGSFSYQLGPLITWTFPNVLVARAEVIQARAQASADIAAFNSVVLNALKETEQALTTYDAELSRHASLIANLKDNQRAFDLAQIQLQHGSISFPDLLQTERNLEAARAALAASDQALIDDQVTVFQDLGGGWENAPTVLPPKSP
jgi:outer membrane protein TolC